jgi:hypothetical protein
MQIQNEVSINPKFTSPLCRHFSFLAVVLCAGILLLLLPPYAHAQSIPDEAYGPYSAVFLADGPGLTKDLATPSTLDSRTAALLDRLGLNQQPANAIPCSMGGPGGLYPSGSGLRI